MTLRKLAAADRAQVPWKNGGGVTSEVAVHPHGAGFGDFLWRISLADVDRDGPFSEFEGVDRILTVLEGEMMLTVGAAEPHHLTAARGPFSFAGDQPAAATLVTARVRDLNVMVRRGVVTATVGRVEVRGAVRLPRSTGASLVLVTQGELTLASGEETLDLATLDAALIGTPATQLVSLSAARPSTALVIELDKPA